jgi:alanyl-tRNA synthetase
MKVSDIRSKFINYFKQQNHQYIESSSLVPHNDKTLLFTNAGMVPFKDSFTGASNPKNPRAVSIQKCVRAGGKHNDLENVGFTARHHTFFEMMGNFSFGDYFKKEAILMAWEFLTVELKIPKSKLYVTAHHSDKEAVQIWASEAGVNKERIFFRGDKDNFWEMGELGPCGPCSEIFYDHGEEYSDTTADTSECILDDESRYVEIWNLVFMQFEKYRENGDIKKRNLPKPSVDTGAGLERLAAVLQGKYNNFDTDCFSQIIKKLEVISGKPYTDYPHWMRVISDHARSATMLLADGVLPSNEGRGYVLRRIIRRAIRHIDLLGVQKITFFELVSPVFNSLGGLYPENEKNREFVEKYLKLEEESFRKTLKSGLKLLNTEIDKIKKREDKKLSGEKVFALYDTHGFPVDLTEMILKENDLDVDRKGFDKAMDEQKNRSKKASDFSSSDQSQKRFYEVHEKFGDTQFSGYESLTCSAKVLEKVFINEKTGIIFDQTPFYAESGGQMGDQGLIYANGLEIKIIDTQKPVHDVFVHFVEGDCKSLKVGDSVELHVDSKKRSLTTANHTGTHLLQAALIDILGRHVKQAGSNVGPDRLRFDFTHPEAVSGIELRKVESLINEKIKASLIVTPEVMSKDEAMNKGAMALFGEKYGEEVRVIDIPGFSVELCGGTHVSNTSEIGYFKILSESSLASGVRRIEACTSDGAISFLQEKALMFLEAERLLDTKGQHALKKIQFLKDESIQKTKELKKLKDQLQSANSKSKFEGTTKLKSGLDFKHINAEESEDIRKLGDLFIDKFIKGLVVITQEKGNKVSVLVKSYKGVSEINCSTLLKEMIAEFNGRGGGKPDMAQGSFDVSFKDQFFKKIKSHIN